MIWFAALGLVLFLIYWMGRLIQLQLVKVVMLLGGTQSQAIVIYSLIFLPGVIIHELTHFMTASVLGVRTGEISVIPQHKLTDQNRVSLGFVKVAKTDFIRESMIGLSPFITGLIILAVLVSLIGRVTVINWQLMLLLYGVLTVTNTMYVSREDRRAFLPIGIFLSLLLILLWWSGWLMPLWGHIEKFWQPSRAQVVMSFAVVLAIDLGWWMILKLWQMGLERITHRRVI